jgi:hypothetical protein
LILNRPDLPDLLLVGSDNALVGYSIAPFLVSDTPTTGPWIGRSPIELIDWLRWLSAILFVTLAVPLDFGSRIMVTTCPIRI